MIPDLLLALLGVPGDVFIATDAPERAPSLAVAEELNFFIKPHERERLNNLIRIGASYGALERVTRSERESVIDHDGLDVKSGSLYRRALANGVDEILDAYEAKILKLEQDALRRRGDAGTLSSIESELSEERAVIPALMELFGEVLDGARGVSGAEVLRRARDAWLRAGHPATRAACERLYWRATQVMMQQLLGWCAHGTIVDPCDEFFVRTIDRCEGLRTKEDDGGGIWHESHRVALERLPPGIELSTAEAVSFIGRGVRILTSSINQRTPSFSFDAEAYAARATARIRKLASAESFDPREFDAVVESMRSEIAEALGEVLLHRSGLVAHLTAMTEFYFLGKGDFYSIFVDEAKELLALPPKLGNATRELATPFAQSAVTAMPSNIAIYSTFKLVYSSALTRSEENAAERPTTPSTAFLPRVHVPEYDAWDGIDLECSIPWPMGIFFTADTQERYKTIFKYLFRLKRVQFDLQETWVRLRRSGLIKTLRLRHLMQQLIENWRTYMQVDVIETEFEKMLEKIAQTKDFNTCSLAHRQYLAVVMAHSFLDVGSIMTIFEDIFSLVRELCEASVRYADGQGLPADWDERLDYLTRQFGKNSLELFDNLRSGYIVELPSLRAFLTRFNFNEFFETAATSGVNLQFEDLSV